MRDHSTLPPPGGSHAGPDSLERLGRRVERERAARQQAEKLLEERSRDLFLANRELARLAEVLEKRVSDRTAELLAERERAMALAQQDHLTGLANRRSFTSVLQAACADPLADGSQLTVVLVDVDRFKEINDTFGHEAGDRVLLDMARRLCATVPTGTAARLGGDEFALIVENLNGAGAVIALAERLAKALCQPVDFEGRMLDISASIGYASLPGDARDAGELLRHADIALYASKKAGRGVATAFTEELRREIEERRLLEFELVLALDRTEIVPWYQPIMDGVTCRMIGVEVLARWHHPDRGLVLPGMFISLAEERNLLDQIFQQTTRQALTELLPLVVQGGLDYVSINISPSQFKSGGLRDKIALLLEQTHFPASALVIEITEDLIMTDLDGASRELHDLHRLGLRIALDDFGTGYSNIAALSQLPIDWLKLDRTLVARVGESRVGQVIVQAVLQMAQALGIDVVAEGIETAEQAAWLVKADCRRQQGFFYSRPGPLSALANCRQLASNQATG